MTEKISYEIQRMLDDEEEDRLTREGQEMYEKEKTMTKILNLTQHVATQEQIEAGVFEPSEEDKAQIQRFLTFDEIPSKDEIETRAASLVGVATKIFDYIDYVDEYNSFQSPVWIKRIVMIGGAPYLMSSLEEHVKNRNIKGVYAFSKRESVDQVQQDGSIKKVAVFKHCGFVEV